MNKIFLINLFLSLLYLHHIDISNVSIMDILVSAIIIFNLFLINEFRKINKKEKGSSWTRSFILISYISYKSINKSVLIFYLNQ